MKQFFDKEYLLKTNRSAAKYIIIEFARTLDSNAERLAFVRNLGFCPKCGEPTKLLEENFHCKNELAEK